MRLAVSNIAWDAADEPVVLERLARFGVDGIEVAPTKLWPDWQGMTEASAALARRRFADRGFTVPAFQAVLFGRPELLLFGERQSRSALVEHLARVAAVAGVLGARTLVFGAPKNRDPGALDAAAAEAIAVEVLSAAGERCAAAGVALGIEANPADYGCTYLTRWSEAARLVRRIDHPGVRLHLDAACTTMAGDDPATAVAGVRDILCHFHISEPHLGTFATPQVDHAAFGAALTASGYDGWLSIEMRRPEDPPAALEVAVRRARAAYGGREAEPMA